MLSSAFLEYYRGGLRTQVSQAMLTFFFNLKVFSPKLAVMTINTQ